MMKRLDVLVISVVALLSGCGTVPMTAAEFREGASKSSLADKDNFEVRRPFAAVARTFQKKAAECLNYSATITTRPTIGYGSSSTTEKAKATVVVSAKKAELSFQVKHGSGQHPMYNQPPDGMYFLVADAYPVGKNRTKVEIVRARVEVVAQAIKLWAAGNDRGCPDPAKVFYR